MAIEMLCTGGSIGGPKQGYWQRYSSIFIMRDNPSRHGQTLSWFHCCKVHPNGCGALEKQGPIYRSLSRWKHNENTHAVRRWENPCCLFSFGGSRTRYTQGHKLLDDCGHVSWLPNKLGYELCIPPKSNRKEPWEYDTELYKRRNEIERNFRRVKEYRRVFTRYDKLDVVYMGFVMFGFIVEALR